jgi:hypothetical protein
MLKGKDIGVITPDIEREHSKIVELLVRQNKLVDGLIESDTIVKRLENVADFGIIDALDKRLGSLSDQLRSTFIDWQKKAVSTEESEAFKRANDDLNMLSVLATDRQMDASDIDMSQPLFFSGDDEKTARETPRKMLRKIIKPKHKKRAEYRQKVAEQVATNLTDEKLVEMEAQLAEIQEVLKIINFVTDVVNQIDTTNLQKIRAKKCQLVVQYYLMTPVESCKTLVDVVEAYNDLKQSLNIEQSVKLTINRIFEMLNLINEKIEKINIRGNGIMDWSEILFKNSELRASGLDSLRVDMKIAGERLNIAYGEVVESANQAIGSLKLALEKKNIDPAKIERLILTIENGNLESIFVPDDFNDAVQQYSKAIDELEKMLKMKSSPELTMNSDSRNLLVEGTTETAKMELGPEYREMKDLFGENFFGFEEVEKAFTLQDGDKLVELSKFQKAEANRLLAQFIQEPDVKQFMDKVKSGEIKKGGWNLRLQISTFTDPKSRLEVPLTMKAFNQCLAPDMEGRNQGKLLYNVDWYEAKKFYTTDTMQFQWVLSTNEVVPTTLDKNHENQTGELKKFAKSVSLDFDAKQSRSKPIETLYRFFVMLRNTSRRVLENTYDWSATKSSDGDLVDVGRCGARGSFVDGDHPAGSLGWLGSSFSRRSGLTVGA